MTWETSLCIFICIFLIVTFFMGLFTVNQQTAAIVERFGKFDRVAEAGLNFKMPWIDYVVGTINLRMQQLNVSVDTKTEDNVFVHVVVAVQYQVIREKIFESFYKLNDAETQIKSFVFDVVRAHVPKLKLDDVFEKKDEIADSVRNELSVVMSSFGFDIFKALVTDIDPDVKVKNAMNDINAAQRERVAANERGEAERIMQVKRAEAESQAKALQGKGIADQRKAIVEGLRESVTQFTEAVEGTTAADVMRLVLMTQFFDTLKDIGGSSRSNILFIPHSPGGMHDIMQQLTGAIEAATPNELDKIPTPRARTDQ